MQLDETPICMACGDLSGECSIPRPERWYSWYITRPCDLTKNIHDLEGDYTLEFSENDKLNLLKKPNFKYFHYQRGLWVMNTVRYCVKHRLI